MDILVLILLYIIYSGLQLIREFINELMGMRQSQTEIDEMKNVLSKMETIVGYHDLLIHNYGPNKRLRLFTLKLMIAGI